MVPPQPATGSCGKLDTALAGVHDEDAVLGVYLVAPRWEQQLFLCRKRPVWREIWRRG